MMSIYQPCFRQIMPSALRCIGRTFRPTLLGGLVIGAWHMLLHCRGSSSSRPSLQVAPSPQPSAEDRAGGAPTAAPAPGDVDRGTTVEAGSVGQLAQAVQDGTVSRIVLTGTAAATAAARNGGCGCHDSHQLLETAAAGKFKGQLCGTGGDSLRAERTGVSAWALPLLVTHRACGGCCLLGCRAHVAAPS